MISRLRSSLPSEPICELNQAKWVVGILSMAIEIVGWNTLLGRILRDACSEVGSLADSQARIQQDPLNG